MTEDKILIQRVLDGDTEAFAGLVTRYEKQVYGLCFRMVNNPEDARDLAQEAFLKAWRGLQFYKSESSFSTWLYRLTVMGLSYGFSALMDNSISASRGLGRGLVPTVIVIMGSCVFRVAWIFTVFAWFGTITSLYLLYIFSWTITGIAEALYFRKVYRSCSRSVQGMLS